MCCQNAPQVDHTGDRHRRLWRDLAVPLKRRHYGEGGQVLERLDECGGPRHLLGEERTTLLRGRKTQLCKCRATPINKGVKGVETVYNRLAYVSDFLVFLLSDYAAEECNLVRGPSGYNGSVPGEIDGLLEDQAPNSVRFYPLSPAQAGVNASR